MWRHTGAEVILTEDPSTQAAALAYLAAEGGGCWSSRFGSSEPSVRCRCTLVSWGQLATSLGPDNLTGTQHQVGGAHPALPPCHTQVQAPNPNPKSKPAPKKKQTLWERLAGGDSSQVKANPVTGAPSAIAGDTHMIAPTAAAASAKAKETAGAAAVGLATGAKEPQPPPPAPEPPPVVSSRGRVVKAPRRVDFVSVWKCATPSGGAARNR